MFLTCLNQTKSTTVFDFNQLVIYIYVLQEIYEGKMLRLTAYV